ncbi:amidohydrolase [Paenibacillus sp. H1-7]|uniref:amidohydrolase family protein n=1 Tax=Paenibacillus sp. H1-7 TaxID=2282849 RepID=UPI001EF8AB2B|nr:amidohydrolase family protein [Paenibacillus sp. H1-7]ULL15063.1 amidohydrolase [Paenibacillus sp. H1-7]
MRIDAHQHYWKLDRGDYDWLTPESTVLYRDFLPEQLKEHLQANGIDKTIVVQAAATVAETEFMLKLAEDNDTIAGVVGWLDLEDAGFRSDYERLKPNRYFKGIRIMLQDIDMEFAFRPAVLEALRFFEREQFPVDLLIKTHQLEKTVKLLEQLPKLHAVIDHIAKPVISAQQTEPWKALMAQIAAEHPNVYCKLSGMVTEADHENWQEEHFVPYVRHVVEHFGPQRVMYGSDWPVCLLAAEYSEVYKLLEHTLPSGLTSTDLEDIFGNNAARFYKL